MKQFAVYMLSCADRSVYVGHTYDLEARVAAHQVGAIPGHTATRRPVTLVFSEEFATRDEAFARERRPKGWSRAKKEALVAGEWDRIRALSRGPNASERTVSGPSTPRALRARYAQGER